MIKLLRSAGSVVFETFPSFPWINSFLLGWKHLGTLQYRLWIEKIKNISPDISRLNGVCLLESRLFRILHGAREDTTHFILHISK